MHVPVFTLFARDIPGSPDGIFAFATVLREKAKAGEAVFVAVRQSTGSLRLGAALPPTST